MEFSKAFFDQRVKIFAHKKAKNDLNDNKHDNT